MKKLPFNLSEDDFNTILESLRITSKSPVYKDAKAQRFAELFEKLEKLRSESDISD